MRELEFKLSEPIKVSVGGDFEESDIIILYSPPAKEKKIPLRLRRGFMQAVNSFADQSKSPPKQVEEKEITGSEVEQMLFMTDAIDIEAFMDNFQKLLFVPGVAVMCGQDLRPAEWDRITAEDSQRLMGVYLATFFVPSWTVMTPTKK